MCQRGVFIGSATRGGTSYEKLWGRKNSGAKCLQLPSHYSSLPPTLIGGTCLFLPSSWGHACCDHNESESYRPTISVDTVLTSRQIRTLVFTEFQSDHREWSHWKVEGQWSILVPLHRYLEEHSPSLPNNLFHPWRLILRGGASSDGVLSCLCPHTLT